MASPSDQLDRPLVLYVEDDDLLAHLVQREIKAFEIVRLCNGEQALQFLNREGPFGDAPRPALVLLDLNMPRKDGFSTLGDIRANPDLATVPVALFTSSQNPAHRTQAFALGANYFIQKPSGLAEFADLALQLARIISPDGTGR